MTWMMLAEAASTAPPSHDDYSVPFWLCSTIAGALVAALIHREMTIGQLVKRMDDNRADFTEREKALKQEVVTANEKCTEALINNVQSDERVIAAISTLEATIRNKLGD